MSSSAIKLVSSLAISASYATSASIAISSSYSNNAVSASYSTTSSYSSNSNTSVSASYSTTSSFATTASHVSFVFTKGGSIYNETGVTNSDSYVVWNANTPCSLVKLSGYRIGGTTAQINAYRIRNSVSAYHTGSNLVISSSNVWIPSISVLNTDYVVGDSLLLVVSGSGGLPTQVAVQCDFLSL